MSASGTKQTLICDGNRIVAYNPYHRLICIFSIFNVPTNVPTYLLHLKLLNCDLLPSFLLVILSVSVPWQTYIMADGGCTPSLEFTPPLCCRYYLPLHSLYFFSAKIFQNENLRMIAFGTKWMFGIPTDVLRLGLSVVWFSADFSIQKLPNQG